MLPGPCTYETVYVPEVITWGTYNRETLSAGEHQVKRIA